MNENLHNWLNKVGIKPIPVLNRTLLDFTKICKNKNADTQQLADVIERDPALCIYILKHSSTMARGSLRAEITSIKQALMLMGTETIKNLPSRLPSVEKNISKESKKMLFMTYYRAYHAAIQAVTWANVRKDMTPDEVYVASLLYFTGEIIVSLYAPKKLSEIYKMRKEKNIATEEAEYIVLGFTLDQLTLSLAKKWQLPELVKDSLLSENTSQARAYGIMLAVQLIRHAEFDWYSEKTLQIEKDAAKWLDIGTNSLISEVHILAATVARQAYQYNVIPLAYYLLFIPQVTQLERKTLPETINNNAQICLTPQIDVLREVIALLNKDKNSFKEIRDVVNIVLKGMHDGIGLNRAVFLLLNHDNNKLELNSSSGTDNDTSFNRISINLTKKNLFVTLLQKQQAIWLNKTNLEKIWPLIPSEFQTLINIKSFFAMSIHINNKPIGVFYADRHNEVCQLDEHSFNHFKILCSKTSDIIARLPTN